MRAVAAIKCFSAGVEEEDARQAAKLERKRLKREEKEKRRQEKRKMRAAIMAIDISDQGKQ